MRTKRAIITTAIMALAVGVVALSWNTGCRVFLPLFGYPPEANRKSAPEKIHETRLKSAATAPGFQLPGTGGEVGFAPESASAGQPQVLVFYRGHW